MVDDAGQRPLVTVIIPMRNEEQRIGECIESVLRQDYPHDRLEVIISDGASTDRSKEVVQEYIKEHPFIRLIDNPHKTQAQTMRLAVPLSAGEYIVRLDAHAEYAEDYISQCVYYLEKSGAEMVGGAMDTRPGADTLMARVVAAIATNRLAIGGAAFRVSKETQYADTVVFGAWPRRVFDQVGLLNPALDRGEDNEFSSRLQRYGGKLLQTPAIRLTYFSRATWGGFVQQLWHNGVWNVLTLIVNPWTFRWRYFIPSVFVLSVIAFGLGSIFWPLLLAPLLAVVVAYLAYLAVIATQIGAKHGWSLLPGVLSCVPTLHVAYGLGTLWGVIRFCIFGRQRRRQAREGSRIPDPDNPPQLGGHALPIEEVRKL